MIVKTLRILLLFMISFSINAQKRNAIKPISIYTFSLSQNYYDFPVIKNIQKLKKIDFVYVNQIDIALNRASFNISDIHKTPSKFIYDDYNSYQNNNFLKDFLVKYDPTRWNLQCIPPAI
ncbi:hypothetical protein [Polaribacter tangerinus]|uniref:hypothetical protein n=1 Tax=Polaribacter tangerinus TaxID=1920034 RepID=UPI00117DFD63|nr:hypothetical protein [Polaribacter tangerinus]